MLLSSRQLLNTQINLLENFWTCTCRKIIEVSVNVACGWRLNYGHMHANLPFAGGIHSEKPPLICKHTERRLLQIKHEQVERKLLVYHLGPIQQHQVCCVSISWDSPFTLCIHYTGVLYRGTIFPYIYPPPPLIPSVNTKWIHNAASIRYPLQNFLTIRPAYLNVFNVF